jgi:hypothetical protein
MNRLAHLLGVMEATNSRSLDPFSESLSDRAAQSRSFFH